MALLDQLKRQFEGPDKAKITAAIAAFAAVVLIVVFFVFFQQPGKGELAVKVVNAEGLPLWRANVSIEIEGDGTIALAGASSGTTDRKGEAVFSGISLGKDLTVEASGEGFKKASEVFRLEKEKDSFTITLEAELENSAQLKTLTFVNPSGVRLEGKLLTVELKCSTGLLLDSPIQQTSSGKLEVQVPSGCGNLSANVSASGFESKSYSVDESGIIRLEALVVENGSTRFIVKSASGNFLDNIQVSINDSAGIPTGEKSFTGFGEATFSLEPGNYTAVFSDLAARYASKEEQFSVSAKETTTVNVELSEKPLGILKVKVVDAGSKEPVQNATIILETPSGKKVSRAFTENFESIPITEQGKYLLSAIAENYSLSEKIEVNSSELSGAGKEFTIELKPCTPSTCGVLKVVARDEDNLPVVNARIGLKDSATGFYAEEYGLKYTDVEGTAIFANVAAGKFMAFAQKYPAEGSSSEFEVVEGVGAEARIDLVIGRGTIEVNVVDADGKAIPFGFAEFRNYSAQGDSLGKLPLDAEGKGALETKADKKVFVVVEAEGYASYTSEAIQVYPEQIVKVSARLEKEVLGNTPQIEFVGLFNENGKEVKQLTAGNSFNARFKITVPTEAEFEQLGIFVRTGTEEKAEKDGLYISAVNAPKASVLKGSTYNAPKGTQLDGENLTNNEAKWASIVWDEEEIRQGIYFVEVQINVRESAVPGTLMPLHYRAYGIAADGKVFRDPFDNELGTAEDSAAKQALYANSHEKVFFEGALEQCDEEFCYSERVLDVREGLYIPAPYDARIFGSYEMEFSLTNNSRTVHDSAELRIKNSTIGALKEEKLKIRSYKITNADAQEFSSSVDTFEIPAIALGNFTQNKTVNGLLKLKPEVLGNTALQLLVVSDKQIVFEKFVPFRAVNEKDLNIFVSPQTLPAFTEFDLNIDVKFFETQEDFLEIEGAFVKVERITPDRRKSVFTATTNGKGHAILRIPASEPGTIIKVKVEKEGYGGKTITRKVSDKILEFIPESISSNLDLTTNTEEKLSVKAKNLVPVELHITDLKMRGNFLGLLDEQRMNSWLSQYVGRTNLPEGFQSEFTVLTAITEDAKFLEEVKELNGVLFVEVANVAESIKWPFIVPAKIKINLAEPPKEEGCIEVTLKEWKDATLSGSAEAEFSIINNCLTQKNQPLDLRSLKAKIEWKSNKFGAVELKVLDPETGLEASEVLSEGIYSTLFDSIPGGKEYIALLVFTPKSGTVGKKAQFKVIIDGAQLTNAGEQLVGASNAIESEIDIIDLSQCIVYTPDAEAGLILQEEEEEGTVEINSSACGNVTIDFWLCKDDDECSGGVEGGLTVKPDKFTLTASNSSKKILVARQDIPGLYGLTVDVRTPGSNYREIAIIDVLAKPEPEDAFALSKYEFSIKGTGAQDSAELTNRFLSETVTVDASLCDWGEATENADSWWSWPYAGVGAIVGAVSGLSKAAELSKNAASTVAQGASTVVDAAKSAASAASAADKISSATAEDVCASLETSVTSTTAAQTSCADVPQTQAPASAAVTALQSAQSTCQSMVAAQSQKIAEIGEQAKEAVEADKLQILEKINNTIEEVSTGVATTKPTSKPYEEKEAYFSIAPTSSATIFTTTTPTIATKTTELTTTESQLQTIASQLETASASLQTASAAASSHCTTLIGTASCVKCIAALQTSTADVTKSVSTTEAYGTEQLAEQTEALNTFSGALSNAESSLTSSFKTMSPVIKTAKGLTPSVFSSPGLIFSAYTLGGFFAGGLLGGLFGSTQPDQCLQRHTGALPDYVINLLTDAGPIDSQLNGINASYEDDSTQVVGDFALQKIGLVVSNAGISDPKPLYSTFTFNAQQHLHANPTKIDKGDSDFGPFNVPDQQVLNLKAKIHLKFKTQEVEEQIPDLTFDTVACSSGNKIGRSGSGALPKVKLDWSFANINANSCLESNPDAVYCDAAQFSIMLSKRLNSLREFFEVNPELQCPSNPLSSDFDSLVSDLNVSAEGNLGEGCFISSSSGFIEGRPAIMEFIEANENSISWTNEIPDKEAFLGMVYFNALLIQDGFSEDFKKDFARHYSEERFFDTPDWFYGLALDSSGQGYGVGRIFGQGRISFTNKFFESERLPSAGTYEVLLNLEGDDGTFRFFNSDGSVNANIKVQLYLLQEPNPNSVFYSMPFDGLVGLEGNSFNRQGYGVSYENADSAEFVTIDNDSQPTKTYTDAGSNPVTFIDSSLEESFYQLNSSPRARGSLLIAEKTSAQKGNLILQPSKATPVLLKVSNNDISEDNFSSFYIVSSSETPIDVGSTLTYWDGAGACLDFSGVVVTESFDYRPDRSALSTDPPLNWQKAYGIDFGAVNYAGDTYLRTIFYTNPLEDVKISAEYPEGKMQFLTPDDSGSKVPLSGVSGVAFNNPGGGSLGTVQSIEDVFNLVKGQSVCVVDSGRKASFFWNPKAVYEMRGGERNISDLTNSLETGKTCIGLSGQG